jgi:hypothetical protein
MRLVFAVTIGLIIQVILYALGAKPFDAFLAFIAVLLFAATYEIVLKYLPTSKD